MLLPDRNLLWLAAMWLALGVLVVIDDAWLLSWQLFGALVAAAALADAFAARRQRGTLRVEREIAHTLPVGTQQTVHLRLSSNGRPLSGHLSGWLTDDHPSSFHADGLALRFELPAGRWLRLGYRVHLTERGLQRFGLVALRLRSPLRLWLSSEHAGTEDVVRVYPNFARITQYTLLASDDRLSQLGVLRRQRRGIGLEFHQLRDYREDDSPRQIDWKATSRQHKLISREYQDERDQQIVFLVDCGQRMRARDETLSHFDHTLNALLLLGYVALRQGDAVGLSTFAHTPPRYLPPRKSMQTVNALLNAVYDIQPSAQTPDYLSAAEALAKRLTRRAMLVIVTNLRDEDEDTLRPALKHLARRHVVLLASLREQALDQAQSAPIANFHDALVHAAAIDYAQSRARQLAVLRRTGVHVMDVLPSALPVALINQYWALKRAGIL